MQFVGNRNLQKKHSIEICFRWWPLVLFFIETNSLGIRDSFRSLDLGLGAWILHFGFWAPTVWLSSASSWGTKNTYSSERSPRWSSSQVYLSVLQYYAVLTFFCGNSPHPTIVHVFFSHLIFNRKNIKTPTSPELRNFFFVICTLIQVDFVKGSCAIFALPLLPTGVTWNLNFVECPYMRCDRCSIF